MIQMEFFIQKINGKDVTKIVDKEILNTLEASNQPIILELCRRVNQSSSNLLHSSYDTHIESGHNLHLKNSFTKCCDSCTQTHSSQQWPKFHIKRRPKSGISTTNNWEHIENGKKYADKPNEQGECANKLSKFGNVFEENSYFYDTNKTEKKINKEYKDTKILNAFDNKNVYKEDFLLEREVASLDRQMQSIRLESQSLVKKHLNKNKLNKKHSLNNKLVFNCDNLVDYSKGVNSSAQNLSLQKRRSVERWIKDIPLSINKFDKNVCEDSSSAYNTGESSRSTPPLLELTLHNCHQMEGKIDTKIKAKLFSLSKDKMSDKSTQFNESDLLSNERHRYIHSLTIKSIKNKDLFALNNCEKTLDSNEDQIKQIPRNLKLNTLSSVIITDKRDDSANFQNSTLIPEMRLSDEIKESSDKVCEELFPPLNNTKQNKFEWKVKRRSDGSRYITSRSIRNKFLKERALKIMEERVSNLTTDDDTYSELKMGRYWNREERKRHLQTTRQRKKLRLSLRSNRMSAIIEHSDERHITFDKNANLH